MTAAILDLAGAATLTVVIIGAAWSCLINSIYPDGTERMWLGDVAYERLKSRAARKQKTAVLVLVGAVIGAIVACAFGAAHV
jgi:hypothetical protein